MAQQQNKAQAPTPSHECVLAQTRTELGQLTRAVYQLSYRVMEAERRVEELTQELARMRVTKWLDRKPGLGV